MKFEQVMLDMKAGKRIARQGWSPRNMWMRIAECEPKRIPVDAGLPTLHGLLLHCNGTLLIASAISLDDLLADDWGVISERVPKVDGATFVDDRTVAEIVAGRQQVRENERSTAQRKKSR